MWNKLEPVIVLLVALQGWCKFSKIGFYVLVQAVEITDPLVFTTNLADSRSQGRSYNSTMISTST